MVGSLINIRENVGFEKFPFIPISYYSHPDTIEDVEAYPTIAKVMYFYLTKRSVTLMRAWERQK